MLQPKECHDEDSHQHLAADRGTSALHPCQLENHPPTPEQVQLHRQADQQAPRLARRHPRLPLAGPLEAPHAQEAPPVENDGRPPAQVLTDLSDKLSIQDHVTCL